MIVLRIIYDAARAISIGALWLCGCVLTPSAAHLVTDQARPVLIVVTRSGCVPCAQLKNDIAMNVSAGSQELNRRYRVRYIDWQDVGVRVRQVPAVIQGGRIVYPRFPYAIYVLEALR